MSTNMFMSMTYLKWQTTIQTTKFSAPNCKELQQLLLIIYKVLPFHLSFIKGVDCLTVLIFLFSLFRSKFRTQRSG